MSVNKFILLFSVTFTVNTQLVVKQFLVGSLEIYFIYHIIFFLTLAFFTFLTYECSCSHFQNYHLIQVSTSLPLIDVLV